MFDTPEPATGARPACTTCGVPPIAQWQRRPTTAEMDDVLAAEEERRTTVLQLADPDGPAPVFPPLPTINDTTIPVYGCAQHAIHVDIAARIHKSTCTGCDCDPEPLPAPTPPPGSEPTITLPTGWTIPAPTPDGTPQ